MIRNWNVDTSWRGVSVILIGLRESNVGMCGYKLALRLILTVMVLQTFVPLSNDRGAFACGGRFVANAGARIGRNGAGGSRSGEISHGDHTNWLPIRRSSASGVRQER